MGFLVTNAVIAVLALTGVFVGLPSRWLWIDAPTVVLAGLLCLSAPAYILPEAHRLRRVARFTAWLTLLLGLLAVLALGLGAGFLAGVSGELAHGGVIAFLLLTATVVAYLVCYPVLQLWWLSR